MISNDIKFTAYRKLLSTAINSAVPECHVKVNIGKGVEASKNESE
jgi:hypothetical protein